MLKLNARPPPSKEEKSEVCFQTWGEGPPRPVLQRRRKQEICPFWPEISPAEKPLCMNAECFGLGRRRALASCGSHRDFPRGGNAASLQCRDSGAGVFGKAVSTQLLELHPCCRANSFQVQAESGHSAKSCLNCAQQVARWDEAVVVGG